MVLSKHGEKLCTLKQFSPESLFSELPHPVTLEYWLTIDCLDQGQVSIHHTERNHHSKGHPPSTVISDCSGEFAWLRHNIWFVACPETGKQPNRDYRADPLYPALITATRGFWWIGFQYSTLSRKQKESHNSGGVNLYLQLQNIIWWTVNWIPLITLKKIQSKYQWSIGIWSVVNLCIDLLLQNFAFICAMWLVFLQGCYCVLLNPWKTL